MIAVYIVLAVVLSIFDIREYIKMKSGRDIVVYICFMTAAITIGIIYLHKTDQPSIAGYILDFFKLKRGSFACS